MSSIEKLSILGIRSFSPLEPAVIHFNTPLTIIVGHNGAGKTTIIECLKFATTGDLPPNSKGGAFIHDLKLTNESEIKAQIKLKFISTNKQPMLAIRSMQVSNKKSKIEQKTLECLLNTIDPRTKNQISVSTRVAELDNEVPRHLGVSKAILENVIFCHQKESCWPLSEPSVLKKKFDEIFSATRYSKALDQLRSIRKEQMQQLKGENQTLEYFKVDLERAKKLKSEQQICQEKMERCQQKVLEIEVTIASIEENIKRNTENKEKAHSMKMELERHLIERNANLEMIEELEKSIKLMNQTDEELAALLDQRSQLTRDSEANLEALTKENQDLCLLASDYQKQIAQKTSEKGILAIQEENFSKRKTYFFILVHSFKESFEGEFENVDLERLESSMIIESFSQALQRKYDQLTLVKEEIKNEEAKFFEIITAKSLNQSSISNEINQLTRKISQNKQEINEILCKQSIENNDESLIFSLKSVLEHEEILLASYQKQLESETFSTQKIILEQELHEKETKFQQLSEKMRFISQFSMVLSKIEMLKEENQRKSISFQETEAICQKQLSCEKEEIQSEMDKIFLANQHQLKIANQHFESTNNSLKSITSKIEHHQRLLEKKRQELEEKTKRINQITGNEDFTLYYEKCEEKLTALNIEAFSTYKGLLSKMNCETSSCPLCERIFLDDGEKRFFQNKLKRALADEKKSIELRAKLEDKLQELKIIRPLNDDAERLRLLEIPELESLLDGFANEKIQIQQVLDDAAKELSNISSEEKKIVFTKKKVEEYTLLKKEIHAISNEIQALNSQSGLKDQEFDSLDALAKESAELTEQITQRKAAFKKLSEEHLSAIQQFSKQQTTVSSLKESISKKEEEFQNLISLSQTKMQLESENSTLLHQISTKEIELQECKQQLEAVQLEKSQKVSLLSKKESTLQALIIKLQSQLNELSAISTSLAQEKTNFPVEISILDGKISMLEFQISQTNEKLEVVSMKIAHLSRELNEIESYERAIRDNLRLREGKKKASSIEMIIHSLQIGLEELDEEGSLESLKRLHLQHSSLLGDRSGLLGEIRILKEQISKITRDLFEQYANVDEKYNNQFVKVSTLEFSIADLERNSKLLDASIMHYHSLKMEEINKIIRELWINTYQGSDIDTIEITSDHENVDSTTRSYNYRVVMLKGESELDMRGRSSAGQRVLTSLIIRLALAEAFGVNCGILALDEPTTNLDRENIQSLAISLVNIIKNRQMQRNFQLIIITHDEEFVSMLGRSEFVDNYWRIGKNAQNYSTINCESFTRAG